MIQDVHGDVVALASETGAILARYAYDGFGRILLSEHDAAGTGPSGTQSIKATANRVGHKGLFFDRYDTPHGWVPGSGIDGLPPTLAAATTGSAGQAGSWASGGVKGLYYNRNRHFSPSLGRFVQRDPNATGLVLAATPAMHGEQVLVWLQPFDVDSHYIDGPQTHAAYGGAPTSFSDPMGLFSMGELSAIGGVRSTQSDYDSDVLDAGQDIFEMLNGLFAATALDQWADFYWAEDWSQPDDFYSRSTEYALGTGTWGQYWAEQDQKQSLAGPAVANAVSDLKAGRTSNTGGVYVLKDASGNVVYVGRTVNMADREKQHRNDPRFKHLFKSGDMRFESPYKNLSYNEMRGLEQKLYQDSVDKGTNKYNKIAPISHRNKMINDYRDAANLYFGRGRRR